jgi:hypothetical protein
VRMSPCPFQIIDHGDQLKHNHTNGVMHMKMSISKVFLLFLAFLFIADSSGCGKVSTDIFPMKDGTIWKYRFKNSATSGFLIVKVSGKEKMDKGEGIIFGCKKDTSEEEEHELFEKEEQRLIAYKRCNPLIDNVETNFSPPQIFLNLPLKTGDSWEWKGKVFGLDSSSAFTVEKKETISIDNKRYECLKVMEKSKSSDGRELECSRWFSPGYGKVKEESKLTTKGSRPEQTITELVDFQAPAEK